MATLPKDQRHHAPSRFAGSSLVDYGILKTTAQKPIRILPDLNIVKIGGQSCFDYGKKVIYPLVKEIVQIRKKHKLLLVTGAGTRARHAYDIGIDLGLPTGVLAVLGSQVAKQNAIMLYHLLAKNGGVRVTHDQLDTLSQFLHADYIPVIAGMPPYGYWEHPPAIGNVPVHRTDTGAYLLAEVLGAKKIIYVKDERGLFTHDPKTHPQAKFIPQIGVGELLKKDLPDLVIERAVLTLMQQARFATQIQIINGHQVGNLTKALNGQPVGSIIFANENR
jgi:molybdenum storage protein